jgi:hypothetical protein
MLLIAYNIHSKFLLLFPFFTFFWHIFSLVITVFGIQVTILIILGHTEVVVIVIVVVLILDLFFFVSFNFQGVEIVWSELAGFGVLLSVWVGPLDLVDF